MVPICDRGRGQAEGGWQHGDISPFCRYNYLVFSPHSVHSKRCGTYCGNSIISAKVVKPTTSAQVTFLISKIQTSFSSFPKVVKATDLNWRFCFTISVGFARRASIPLVVVAVYFFCIFWGGERRGETPCLVACSVFVADKVCLSKIQVLRTYRNRRNQI